VLQFYGEQIIAGLSRSGILQLALSICSNCPSTGAAIACHSANGIDGLHLLQILSEEGTDPNRPIVLHSDIEEDTKCHLQIARSGAWVEYGLREETAERTLSLMQLMLDNGFGDQILLSQDVGWYNVGEPRGADIRGLGYLVREFVPLVVEKGFSRELVDKILVENPARAFQLE
jgi:phosphotriesterase-related protein